jgi:hypothetical protein
MTNPPIPPLLKGGLGGIIEKVGEGGFDRILNLGFVESNGDIL